MVGAGGLLSVADRRSSFSAEKRRRGPGRVSIAMGSIAGAATLVNRIDRIASVPPVSSTLSRDTRIAGADALRSHNGNHNER